MSVDIRLVGDPAEIDAVAAIDRRCFPRPWTQDQWALELAAAKAGRGVIVLAWAGPQPIGMACTRVVEDGAELRRIAVVHEHRRRGIARDLALRVIDHARLAACTRMELEVAAVDAGAVALYQALGFTKVGVRPRYYVDPPSDAWLMDLRL